LIEETAERTWAVERARAEAEHEEAREALAVQSRFLEATLSSIPDFIHAFDRDRRFIYVNRSMQPLFGLSASRCWAEPSPTSTTRLTSRPDSTATSTRSLGRGEAIEDEIFYTSPIALGRMARRRHMRRLP
jgi:PAS domain-containing protein